MFEAQIFKMYLLGAYYGGVLARFSLLGDGGGEMVASLPPGSHWME